MHNKDQQTLLSPKTFPLSLTLLLFHLSLLPTAVTFVVCVIYHNASTCIKMHAVDVGAHSNAEKEGCTVLL